MDMAPSEDRNVYNGFDATAKDGGFRMAYIGGRYFPIVYDLDGLT